METPRSSSCARVTGRVGRREFLRATASMPLVLGLSPPGEPGLSLRSRLARPDIARRVRARSVLIIWLRGGPSQLDSFDPKPDAPLQIRGPLATIPTRSSGVRFAEIVPRLAASSDQFAVVRSTRLARSHDMMPLAGGRRRDAPPGTRGLPPHVGSIVARHRVVAGLPSFISVAPVSAAHRGLGSIEVPGHGAGALGRECEPFIVTCSAAGRVDIPRSGLVDPLDADRWNRRREGLCALLDSLGEESERRRVAYGRTSFGQSLLLGARLVEAGVPCVQVNWILDRAEGREENTGWDTHRNAFGQLRNFQGPILDRALAALIGDLSQRGLLASTLVVAMGEMGRAPHVNRTGGRDHWPTCSTLWAGAGVCGGRVVGQTDGHGAEPVTTPISALMVGTTIAELAGVHASARAAMGVLQGGRVIEELF